MVYNYTVSIIRNPRNSTCNHFGPYINSPREKPFGLLPWFEDDTGLLPGPRRGSQGAIFCRGLQNPESKGP